jgi:hypothetical protein
VVEHQAARAVPQPTDNMQLWKLPLSCGERGKLNGGDDRRQKGIPITDFFNTHNLWLLKNSRTGKSPKKLCDRNSYERGTPFC